jgi:formiminotetrahydrofolate cyclodeaminase
MPDFVIVNGQRVELPRECENDMAARAAFIQKATKAAKTAEKE